MRYLVLTAVLLFFLGCSKKPPTPLPIPEEKMIQILADVHIAEAAIAELKQKHRDSIAPLYYDQIFTIHNVDSSLFNQTFAILQAEPHRLNKMYETVFERLTILKESYKESKQLPEKKDIEK